MMLGRDADRDPLDISRVLIAEAADRASRYARMVLELIEMRDDDAARSMAMTMMSQVKVMSAGFNSLASGRADSPAKAAKRFFDRDDSGVAQP